MKPVLDVVAGIIWRDGYYLAVERPKGKSMAGWWEFPGGKIEPGETREQALVRELQEELGITPFEFEFWQELRHEYDTISVCLYFFQVWNFTGQPVSLENQKMKWVNPASPPCVNFLAADLPVVSLLHSESQRVFRR